MRPDRNFRRVRTTAQAISVRQAAVKVVAQVFKDSDDVALRDICNALEAKCKTPGWLNYAAVLGVVTEMERRALARETFGQRWLRLLTAWWKFGRTERA